MYGTHALFVDRAETINDALNRRRYCREEEGEDAADRIAMLDLIWPCCPALLCVAVVFAAVLAVTKPTTKSQPHLANERRRLFPIEPFDAVSVDVYQLVSRAHPSARLCREHLARVRVPHKRRDLDLEKKCIAPTT